MLHKVKTYQDNIQDYDHRIAFERRRVFYHGKWAPISVIAYAAITYCIYRLSWGWAAVWGFFTFMVPILFISSAWDNAKPHFVEWVNQSRFRRTARKYSELADKQVWSAYENVKMFLIDPRDNEKMSPRLHKKMHKVRDEMNNLSTEELARMVEKSGIWNVSARYYKRGRNIEEAILNALYTHRTSRHTAHRMAAEEKFDEGRARAQSAPNFEQRSTTEMVNEIFEMANERLGGTGREAEKLLAFDGEYVLYTSGRVRVRIIFTLPKGRYQVELFDRSSFESEKEEFEIAHRMASHEVSLMDRKLNMAQTEVILSQGEKSESIPLW